MRSCTRKMFRILNNEKLMPVELLTIKLLGAGASTTLRFTNAGEQITWDGNEYTPVNMSRGSVEDVISSVSGESPGTQISIANIDGQMATLVNHSELEGAVATLWMADRRLLSNPRDAITICSGEIIDPQINEQVLSFTIVNVIGMIDKVTVPRRMWQARCNYTFGSRSCGVNLSVAPNTITGTVQSGSTDSVIVINPTIISGLTQSPDETWANGYIVMRNGPASPQARPFMRYEYDAEDDVHKVYLRHPLLVAPEVGNEFFIRRGCRKTMADCKARQGNTLNFGGFPGVPYGRIKPQIVDDYD